MAAKPYENAEIAYEKSAKYGEDRGNLLQTESETAWDCHARNKAGDLELKAGAIMGAIRVHEEASFKTLEMGGRFLTNKRWIEKRSKLFKIAEQVPKGALLHIHLNSGLPVENFLVEARKMINMCIRSTKSIMNPEDLETTEIVFGVKPADTKHANVFSSQYLGMGDNWKDDKVEPWIWMKWSEFQRQFKARYGNSYTTTKGNIIEPESLTSSSKRGAVVLEPAESWLLQKMVFREEDVYNPAQTTNGIWARFNQATRCFKGLFNYEKMYKWYISNLIDQLIADKVMYAELRPMLLDKGIPTDDGKDKLTIADQMRLLVEGVKEKQDKLKNASQGDLFPFGLKIIYCTPRSISKKLMQVELMDCIKLKKQYPDLVCGFDLVGAEDRPNNIGYYYEELVAFKKMCADEGLEIPFLFHAGETLLDTGGTTDPTNSNIYDACLLGSKRIGHGYSLLKHPCLLPYFRKTATQPGICIELCPISNELLHLCRNIKAHQFPHLLAQGIPCTINSDNPSIFSNSMSHEFYQIMVGAHSMTIHSWKQLALWSLEYSCLKEEEKEKGKDIFLRSWKLFCEDIVSQYGGLGRFGKDEARYSFEIDIEKAKKAYGSLVTGI